MYTLKESNELEGPFSGVTGKVLDQQWSTEHMGVCTCGNSLNCTPKRGDFTECKDCLRFFFFLRWGQDLDSGVLGSDPDLTTSQLHSFAHAAFHMRPTKQTHKVMTVKQL